LTGFSEGLHAELLNRGVRVTTVCPGLMRTGGESHAQFRGQVRKEKASCGRRPCSQGFLLCKRLECKATSSIAINHGSPELKHRIAAEVPNAFDEDYSRIDCFFRRNGK
jgi:NAD(P)-dependent dehydrogenase (short-subunit alcohol dehydrogenase family)